MSYKEWKNEAGYLHREDGPAQISYYPDGSIYCEVFYVSGVRHRESGPAQISYYPDGSIHCEFFHVNGHLHREDGPAQISYNPDGSNYRECFYIAGDFLGYNKAGFWAFWKTLTEECRQAQGILKCLARFS